ncbi:putative leucine zipper protein [Schistosoma mansoni]|nr:putative leucine zipper protein [Schistosoma mansoni]|eukprot:XP_018652410.1 putative leucine zipper protein [Schistosoma mansoni]
MLHNFFRFITKATQYEVNC